MIDHFFHICLISEEVPVNRSLSNVAKIQFKIFSCGKLPDLPDVSRLWLPMTFKSTKMAITQPGLQMLT